MSWQAWSAWELKQPHDAACPVHTFPQDVMTDKFKKKKLGGGGGGGGGGDCFEVDLENFDVKIDVSWQDFSGIYW